MFFLNKNLISFDIGASSIKMVEVLGKKGKEIKKIDYEMLPAGAVVSGMIENMDQVSAAMANLASKNKILLKQRFCALSIGGSPLVVRRSVFPKIEDDIFEQVELEAGQHFQFDLEELHIEHEVQDAYKTDQGTPVLICGAKMEVVQSYVDVAVGLGMQVAVVDSDILCLVNLFESLYPQADGLNAIVNVGASGATVILTYGTHFLFSRDIPSGGIYYTEQISSQLSMSVEEAESIKIASMSGGTSPDLMRVLNELNDQLVQEIEQCIEFYFQSGDAPPNLNQVQRFFLSGGGSVVLGLDAAIANRMRGEVILLDPFQNRKFKSGKDRDKGSELRHIYGVTAGLSLRTYKDDVD